jgi:hypothetical protein
MDIGVSSLDPQTVRRRISTNQLNLQDLHTCLEHHISPGATSNLQRIDRVRDDGQQRCRIAIRTFDKSTRLRLSR